MTRTFLTIIFSLAISAGYARNIDPVLLEKLDGTKWELVEEKKLGRLFYRTDKHPKRETITFSGNNILFDLADANYGCVFERVQHTLWLYCTEPDQYIYRIRELHGSELVMDLKVKNKDGSYTRKKRLTYRRIS